MKQRQGCRSRGGCGAGTVSVLGHWRRRLSPLCPPEVPPTLCSSCPARALSADWSHRLTSEGQTQLGDEAQGGGPLSWAYTASWTPDQHHPQPLSPKPQLPPLQLYVGLNCCFLRIGNEHSQQRCCSGDTLALYLLVFVLFCLYLLVFDNH